MKPMDKARLESKARDAARKPDGGDWASQQRQEVPEGDLSPAGAHKVLRRASRGNHCPDCKDSVAFMRWDKFRQLWVHERCGGTWTIEELTGD